jgi:SRSO17 transposase
VLAGARWRRLSWRRGTRGALAARFAAVRVRVADGRPDRAGRHLPGEEAWLVGERRSGGERRFYLSDLPPGTALRDSAAAIKARWVCEQAHQQLRRTSSSSRSWASATSRGAPGPACTATP